MPPKTIVRFAAFGKLPGFLKSNAAEALNQAEKIAAMAEGDEITTYRVTLLEIKRVRAIKSVTVEDA